MVCDLRAELPGAVDGRGGGDASAHPHDMALHTAGQVGSTLAGWFSAQPLFDVILNEQPELLDWSLGWVAEVGWKPRASFS